ncbi:hypothetical protein D3C76_1525750 [compost metagenome]
MQPLLGDVHISENPNEGLGRVSTEAWLFKPGPSPDIIPRLLDVKITCMAQGGMNLTGVEDIDGCLYAQSWWCRPE